MYFNNFTTIVMVIIAVQLHLILSHNFEKHNFEKYNCEKHNFEKYNCEKHNFEHNDNIKEGKISLSKQLETNLLDDYNKQQYYQGYQNGNQKYKNKYKNDYNTEKLWIHPLFNLMNHIVTAIYLLVMEYFKVFQYSFCYTLDILVKLIDGYYHLLELLFKDILQYPTICYVIIAMFIALYQCNIIIKTIIHSKNERYTPNENLDNNN